MNQNLLTDTSEVYNRYSHVENVIKLILKAIIPIFILIGGLILLTLKIPGWGLILGLPMTVIGVVFLIYSYDEVVASKFKNIN